MHREGRAKPGEEDANGAFTIITSEAAEEEVV